MAENKNLRPLLKYPGGKERELNHINDALPSIINNYYEPFLGGGAVYFNINAKHYYVNDKSVTNKKLHSRTLGWKIRITKIIVILLKYVITIMRGLWI